MTSNAPRESSLTDSSNARKKRSSLIVSGCCAVVGLVSLALLWSSLVSEDSPPGSEKSNSVDGGQSKSLTEVKEQSEPRLRSQESLDEIYRKRILGKWVTERNGTRRLNMRQDGTADMDVTITSWHRVLFGDRILFQARWEIKEGILSFETTGGEPSTAVEAVIRMYGNTREHEIIRCEQDSLIIKDDEEGEPDHVYARPAS